MLDRDDVLALGGNVKHHRSEKRLGRRIQNLQQLSCLWAKVSSDRTKKPDFLLYEFEWRYCIRCCYPHYHIVKELEFEESNPLSYTPGVDRRMENWLFAKRF